ncbi:MAG: hypothetical protein ACKO1M_04130 [Planctomycetota bacterium]
MIRRTRRCVSLLVATVSLPLAAGEPSEPRAFPEPLTMRVESDLFSDGGDEPVARSLTLFDGGVAWDFLELPTGKDQPEAGMQLVEIVLHDPARERVVVIDPVRRVKTEIPLIRLERMSVSLAKWARSSDDRLVRWAGGPDFTSNFAEEEETLVLSGPRVRYAVTLAAAESPEAAVTYRQFADTAILLKALLHPGGIPPFPRLALNRRLEAEAAIPSEVTLEIDPRLAIVAGGAARLRSVHKSHPRLLAADRRLIADAEAHVAGAESVDLAAFAAPVDASSEAHRSE